MSSDPVLDAIDRTLHDFEVSGDAMRWTPEPHPAPVPTAEQFAVLGRAFGAIGEFMNAYAKAVRKAVLQIGKVYAKFGHVLTMPNHKRARCRVCSPMANPRPLAINGLDYHRRQKRRNRR